MKKVYSLLLFLLIASELFGQKLAGNVQFSSNSAFLEPDSRTVAYKLKGEDFITLAKAKGGLNGPSDYLLERFDFSLNVKYSIPLRVSPDEDFLELFANDKDIILLSVIHDMYKKASTLKAYIFDLATGQLKEEKPLQESPVKPWAEVKYKGAVKESFTESMEACNNLNFITPPDYKYYIQFSPDRSKFVAYLFDYSQKNLFAKSALYNTSLELLSEGVVPIDNNFVNYGLYPNNRGEIYILNVDKLGRVVLIQYNLSSKDHKLLDVQYSSTNRESLRLKMLNDDVVYVANTNVQEGSLVGVMYAKFNFKSNLIEKLNYHEISTGLKQTVSTAREVNSYLQNEEDWRNYEITDFIMNEFEKIILVLEKRENGGGAFFYDGGSVQDIKRWNEKISKVSTEGVLLFSFNMNDELLWENFYVKSQIIDVTGGFTSSFTLDNTAEGKLRMVYAGSENPGGILNQIKFVEWDEYNGNRIKEIVLEDDNKLSIIRNYALFWEDKLVVVGRKGLLGKKTFMNLYKFE